MMLAKLGAIMECIAVLILYVKFLIFYLTGNFSGEAIGRFISEIVTFGIGASIPLEVTLIQVFGLSGVFLIIVDLISDRLNW